MIMTDLYSYQPFCNQNEKLGKLCRMGEIVIMKRKLNKLISTKEQLPLTLKPMNAKKSMTHEIGNLGFGLVQAH